MSVISTLKIVIASTSFAKLQGAVEEFLMSHPGEDTSHQLAEFFTFEYTGSSMWNTFKAVAEETHKLQVIFAAEDALVALQEKYPDICVVTYSHDVDQENEIGMVLTGVCCWRKGLGDMDKVPSGELTPAGRMHFIRSQLR
jgi:hypothetical protein